MIKKEQWMRSIVTLTCSLEEAIDSSKCNYTSNWFHGHERVNQGSHADRKEDVQIDVTADGCERSWNYPSHNRSTIHDCKLISQINECCLWYREGCEQNTGRLIWFDWYRYKVEEKTQRRRCQKRESCRCEIRYECRKQKKKHETRSHTLWRRIRMAYRGQILQWGCGCVFCSGAALFASLNWQQEVDLN